MCQQLTLRARGGKKVLCSAFATFLKFWFVSKFREIKPRAERGGARRGVQELSSTLWWLVQAAGPRFPDSRDFLLRAMLPASAGVGMRVGTRNYSVLDLILCPPSHKEVPSTLGTHLPRFPVSVPGWSLLNDLCHRHCQSGDAAPRQLQYPRPRMGGRAGRGLGVEFLRQEALKPNYLGPTLSCKACLSYPTTSAELAIPAYALLCLHPTSSPSPKA